MAHLLSADGQTLALVDGLGVSPLALAPGDMLVQRHSFDAGAVGDDLWLLTGAYWLDTMSRWPVQGDPETGALLVGLHIPH